MVRVDAVEQAAVAGEQRARVLHARAALEQRHGEVPDEGHHRQQETWTNPERLRETLSTPSATS